LHRDIILLFVDEMHSFREKKFNYVFSALYKLLIIYTSADKNNEKKVSTCASSIWLRMMKQIIKNKRIVDC
jgi:sulfur transfer protein SufE